MEKAYCIGLHVQASCNIVNVTAQKGPTIVPSQTNAVEKYKF